MNDKELRMIASMLVDDEPVELIQNTIDTFEEGAHKRTGKGELKTTA